VSGLAVPQAPIPVTLLTGYLGSGKTTVLRHLLDQPEMAGTAVIVNEFGDIGLDHLLLERGEEGTLLLDSGCLCCALKSDLVITLQSMLGRAERGDLPAFDRVVIETTGLADPGALIRAFWSDPLRLSRYRHERTVTCIDAVAGAATLERHGEARRQAALADLLLITKTDIQSAAPASRAVRRHNPTTTIREARFGDVTAAVVFAAAANADPVDGPGDCETEHGTDIAAVSATAAGELSWNLIEAGLGALNERYGERLLRLKGLLAIEGVEGAVRVDAVQGLYHRPQILSQNIHETPGSRLVAIAQGVDPSVLRRELTALLDRSAVQEQVRRPA
jgi:G3E family GTPase